MGGTICICSRPEDQVSKSLAWLPWFVVNRFLQAIDHAEEKLQQPPTIPQIFVTLEDHFNAPINNVY